MCVHHIRLPDTQDENQDNPKEVLVINIPKDTGKGCTTEGCVWVDSLEKHRISENPLPGGGEKGQNTGNKHLIALNNQHIIVSEHSE